MNDAEQWLKDTQHYFIGAFSLISDDLPDGAFYQSHIDDATFYTKTCKECMEDLLGMSKVKKPKSIDEYDIVNYYFNNNPNHTKQER